MWRKTLTRWFTEGPVHGRPEIERFPDDATRAAALRNLNRAFYTWRIVPVAVLHVGVLLAAFFGMREIVSPLAPRWAGRLSMAVVLLAYMSYIHFAVRRDIAKALRGKLLEAGVPVCLKCGYDLRGQTAAAAQQCPERGWRYAGDRANPR